MIMLKATGAIIPLNRPHFAYPIYDILSRAVRMITRRAYRLHRNEGHRPFFIVGAGRSGNTLLRRILQASRDVHIPAETFVLGHAIRLFLRNRHMPWDHLVRLIMGLFEFHREFDKFEISLRPLVNRLMDTPADSRSLALVLDAFYRYHGEQTHQTFVRWGDKTPYNTYSLDLILAVFPDARFVHMLRDGPDSVYSYVNAGLQPDLVSAARRWKTSVRAVEAFARRHPARCLEVRYEHLVDNPAAVSEHVCEFLDVHYEPRMVEQLEHVDTMGDVTRFKHLRNVANPISTTSVGRGRRELGATEKLKIQTIIGKELERLGYEPLL